MTGGQHGWAPPPDQYYLQAFQALAPAASQVCCVWPKGLLRAAIGRLALKSSHHVGSGAQEPASSPAAHTRLSPTHAQLHAQGATSGTLTPAELRAAVRRAFRQPPAGSSSEAELDAAFGSLRLLGEQVQLQRGSSSATTEGVHVEVLGMG